MPTIPSPPADSGPAPAALECLLRDTIDGGLAPLDRRGPGRPQLLPATALWSALTIGVLHGDMAQVEIWRRLVSTHWWYRGQLQISKEAVYHRLDRADPSPMEPFFRQVTTTLLARRSLLPEWADLAPWATEIVALDESTLDTVARTVSDLRGLPAGASELLGGKLTALFDLRRQLLRSVQIQDSGVQNERIAARDAIVDLPSGSLILADLGYFGFAWFDHLTRSGYHWVSKCRRKTSYEITHVIAKQGTTLDALVWLGAYRADQAQYPVRLIQFEHQGVLRSYLTNVTNPALLSIVDVARVYARRWDIELVFKLLKTDLHLELLWSAKMAVIRHQVWAVVLIAQLILAARSEVALRAGVTVDEVSLRLLVRHLPQYALHEADPIGAFVRDGRLLGFIRPSRRLVLTAPAVPPEVIDPPPIGPHRDRKPRYAGKR